jgi:hypothetical protein
MAKTVVSAFHNQEVAAQVLNSMLNRGYDSRYFSVIQPAGAAEQRSGSMLHDVPSIQARLYRKDLQKGDSIFVARVSENDVARLIKLLQATGGHHIEAFDVSKAS